MNGSGILMKTIMVDMDDVITYGNFSKILEDYLGYVITFKIY